MKILHISTEQGFRGGERQLVRIHEGLLERGVESMILYRSTNKLLATFQNVSAINYQKIRALFAPFILGRKISAFRPDLIHCHDSRALSLAAIIKPFLKIPVVVSRKTVYPLDLSAETNRKFRAVDHLIAVSNAAAAVVRNRFPNLPITVICDGVEVRDSLDRDVVRHRFGIDKATILFASVGYFSAEKNVPLLRKCADLLAKSNIDAKILLIGPVLEKFRPLVENHPAIICAGKIDSAETHYSGFDCYLSTSLREGLGSALLDAVIRDLPVIALDSGGSRDIFEAGDPDHLETESAFLKRFSELCSTGFDLERSSQRGALNRSRFSVSQLQHNHLALYNEILGYRVTSKGSI